MSVHPPHKTTNQNTPSRRGVGVTLSSIFPSCRKLNSARLLAWLQCCIEARISNFRFPPSKEPLGPDPASPSYTVYPVYYRYTGHSFIKASGFPALAYIIAEPYSTVLPTIYSTLYRH